jgi:integrase
MSRPKAMIARVEAYLHTRRQFGFQLRIEGAELLRFGRYADGVGHRGAVTTELALRWAQDAAEATPLYRARRLEVVRSFAKYQVAFEPETEIPAAGILGPAHRRTAPYIFSPSEIERVLAAAGRLSSPGGLRAKTYVSLIGLLACTGLRISEALRLGRADADLGTGVLSIRQTKFCKSRLVPLHRSARVELRRYVVRRDAIVPPLAGATLFVSESGRALSSRTVHCVARKLLDSVIPTSAPTNRRPRIHDLRHTFACRRLLQWYRDGVDLDQRVAALSTYLGHAKVSDTYWYLTGVPELMAIAATRFERFRHEGGDNASRV